MKPEFKPFSPLQVISGLLYAGLVAILTVFMILLLSLIHLRMVNPSLTAFTAAYERNHPGHEQPDLREYWVDPEDLPEFLIWAVIASEDQLFWEHRGFDRKAIEEALGERAEGGRARGASTLSQQLAKNLYLWPAQTFFRKGVEAVITVFLELLWPKERILEVYLNTAEFAPGVFGAGRGAQHHFGVDASEITPNQAARLAAVLPSPARMDAGMDTAADPAAVRNRLYHSG
jgi:monofunctional biosynthetic peptidoglycan transglycosylase